MMKIDKSDFEELRSRIPKTKNAILEDDKYCKHEKRYIDSKSNKAARRFVESQLW